MVSQISEVEARQERYDESLALLGLVNALLHSLGPAGLPSGGVAVAQYTTVVLNQIVAHIWQRGYRCVRLASMWHRAGCELLSESGCPC